MMAIQNNTAHRGSGMQWSWHAAVRMVLSILLFSASRLAAEPLKFAFYELGDIGYPLTVPYDISNSGQIVGTGLSTEEGDIRALSWVNGTIVDWFQLPGAKSVAACYSISDDGTAFCHADGIGDAGKVAIIRNGIAISLPTPEACDKTDYPDQMSASGLYAIGYCDNASGYTRPTFYDIARGTSVMLEFPIDDPSHASSATNFVNSRGEAVGTAYVGENSHLRNFYWADGVLRELFNSVEVDGIGVAGINDQGILAVGIYDHGIDWVVSYDLNTGKFEALWPGGILGINNRNEFLGVGTANGEYGPLVYSQGSLISLVPSLPSDYFLHYANAMNDYAWVIGNSFHEDDSVIAWLLVPIYSKGDYDGDDDVDFQDFGKFQECFAAEPYQGPEGGLHVGCSVFDFDDDIDLDSQDFAAFNAAFTGPTAPDLNPTGPG